jgi:magnesium chelatase family protein
MALTQLHTRARQGIQAPRVGVEIHISNGLPAFSIVGLPEAAVRESRDRVRSAIINSGFEFPARRITVNLAPADLPKEGGRYDLAIALGILEASGQIRLGRLADVECYAELALGGELRPVSGLIPALVACAGAGGRALIASGNAAEAGILDRLDALQADSLAQICASLAGGDPLPGVETLPRDHCVDYALDLRDVLGQAQARRALEIAAAGGHHLLMMGPPGTGKSMLAQRLNTLLPPMDEEEALQTLSIHSIGDQALDLRHWRRRPFRSPHHTVSGVALVGGGAQARPGEVSLAHNGVLFLDELTEFDRKTLEVLREPLETGEIHISRAARQETYPAAFQLVAAMNPCPGGCPSIAACQCSAEQLTRYRNKLSAPLLDRIDIQIELPPLDRSELMEREGPPPEDSASVRERVIAARNRQIRRQGRLNARLDSGDIDDFCTLNPDSSALLGSAIDKLKLSARSYHRLLKLARTIADLAGDEAITTAAVSEAIGYRRSAIGNG